MAQFAHASALGTKISITSTAVLFENLFLSPVPRNRLNRMNRRGLENWAIQQGKLLLRYPDPSLVISRVFLTLLNPPGNGPGSDCRSALPCQIWPKFSPFLPDFFALRTVRGAASFDYHSTSSGVHGSIVMVGMTFFFGGVGGYRCESGGKKVTFFFCSSPDSITYGCLLVGKDPIWSLDGIYITLPFQAMIKR